MNRKYDVVTVGLQCIDIVTATVTAGVLDRDQTIVDSAQMMLGGDALNQAIVLARLGARVALAGVVGSDPLGDVLLAQLSKYPLTVLSRRADVRTSISQVLIDESGERHFVYMPESNLALSYEHIDEDAVKSASFLSVGGCLSLPGLDGEGMARLLDLAHAAGTQAVLDFKAAGRVPGKAALRDFLRRADYVLPSEIEARAMIGDDAAPEKMAAGLHDLGAGNVIIKLGGRGCYVSAEGFECLVPPYPCRCVDTTGAGDTFVGAFLYAKTRGWDIEKCARFANAAGSIAVEHIGANTAIQSAAQVEQRMLSRPV